MKLHTISEIEGVFTDAFITDNDGALLFLSCYGRDTSVQEFLARLTIPKHQHSIRDFKINDGNRDYYIKVPLPEKLDKYSCRVGSDIFQNLTQIWIYDKSVMKHDIANRRVYQLFSETQKCPDPWPLIKSVCSVPLLDCWREPIIKLFSDYRWCEFISDECGVGMRALKIDLSDPDVEDVVSNLVKTEVLTLENIIEVPTLEYYQSRASA